MNITIAHKVLGVTPRSSQTYVRDSYKILIKKYNLLFEGLSNTKYSL